MKNTTLALCILAALLALASVSGVQTKRAYVERVADDKSFTMQVPGEYMQLENLEYLRQKYDVPGNAILGFGTPQKKGLLVIRRIMDDIDPAITSEEMIEELSKDVSRPSPIEKVIINDVPFIKAEDITEQGVLFMTYYKQSIYIFVFTDIAAQEGALFKDEIYNMMNTLKFNPDPNI